MYLKNTSNEVKKITEKINELDKENKLKFISYILNLWDNDQINSLNETNPDLLDDSICIDIFNPSSIGYHYLVAKLNEYWNHTYKLYHLYQEEYKRMMPLFEKLSFKEKINVLAEIFLILEHDKLLPDNVDSYEIARIIIKN